MDKSDLDEIKIMPKSCPSTNTLDTQPQSQSQTQFSKWLSSSDQSLNQDQHINYSSRPSPTVRKHISNQFDLLEQDNSDNDKFSQQSQSHFQLYKNSQLSHKYNSSGICGLTNLGNSCFFNSALQCILHSHHLIDYMLSGKYKSDLAPRNRLGTKGQLAKAFNSLIDRIYTQKVTIEAPKEILSILSFYAPHFAGFTQQDAHELLIFLLDLLHEDMNRAKRQQEGQSQGQTCQDQDHSNSEKSDDEFQKDDQIVAEKAWNLYKSKNDSIIVDLFHGLLQSQLICPSCNKKVVIFEPFVTLSLPIPGQPMKSSDFIFVPYDTNQPKIRMSIPLTFGLDALCFKRNLNAELGRKFDIAMCIRSRSSSSFEWTNVVPTRENIEFFVFEIPDVKNGFYSVCSITVNRKKSSFFFPSFSSLFGESREVVEDFILVPINKMNVEKDELEEICEKRLEFLWNIEKREGFPMSEELIEFISSCENFSNNVQKKFTTEIITTFFDRSQLFEKSKNYPFILNKTIKITLNPAYMKDYMGFNWSRLIKPAIKETLKNHSFFQPTLENCIKQFCMETVLDENNMWYCPHCKEFVKAKKETFIWSLPKCIIFQFKRFTQFYNSFRKKEGKIEFPQFVDFRQFIKGPVDSTSTKYKLYAVCEHYGSMSGGHYVAHAYIEERDKWYLFNDSSCRPVNEQDVHNDAAYLLFYERIDE